MEPLQLLGLTSFCNKKLAATLNHATELADHEERISALEGDNTTNKQAIADLKAKNTQQDTAISGNTDSITQGVKETDVEITGEGDYTVALDFTGTAQGHSAGIAFSALAVSNGELLFPGYVMEIQEILINGEPYSLG